MVSDSTRFWHTDVCSPETFHWSQSKVPMQSWLMLFAWQTEQLLEMWMCFFDLKQRRQGDSENEWPAGFGHYLFMRIEIFDHELHRAEWWFVLRKWKWTEKTEKKYWVRYQINITGAWKPIRYQVHAPHHERMKVNLESLQFDTKANLHPNITYIVSNHMAEWSHTYFTASVQHNWFITL